MSTFRILIAEHETTTVSRIEKQLCQWGYNLVYQATSRSEAEQLYKLKKPDLTLINMHLRRYGEGIQFAHFIRRRTHNHPIIYMAEDLDRRQLELAKPTLPAGFLFKPIQPDLLYANVEIALHKFASQPAVGPVLMLNDGEESYPLPVNSILYLEANHVYVQVHMTNGQKILQRRALSDLLEQLPPTQFIQTHRSFAVNIKELTRWDKQHVYVDGRAVPLSRGRRNEVLNTLAEVVSSRMWQKEIA